MTLEENLKSVIRDVPDFPKPGILFKDISTIMLDPKLSKEVLAHLKDLYQSESIDAVAGIESRGFLFGYPLAMRLEVPFVLIRKKGKLPHKVISVDYNLEYGSATVEMHVDALTDGQKVLIHDDLLATGGSAGGAAMLIEKAGAEVAGFNFLVALEFLKGADVLKKYSDNITNLVSY